MIRNTKILAALMIGAIGLLFFLDNLFNLQTAHSVVALIVSGQEQPWYKLWGPAITQPWLTWAALATIMGMELAVGILGLIGAAQLIANRSGSNEAFHHAKRFAVLAGVLGMTLWYGFFVIIGESYFNMWQTETGLGSVAGAFRYGTICAVLLFYIRSGDD
jgi:predicted small integral membrane protein